MSSSPALALLSSVFGYSAFREGQGEVVDAVLAGRDVFVVMPTGSGKSLCYQLPALLQDGLTVVVSPLIALMRDQVMQLTRLGAGAAALNSQSEAGEARDIWAAMDEGRLKLLFVSPERLASGTFAENLARRGVTRLAIDEAHCVSQWGHDFRPEYRLLPELRERLGGVPVTALTATADKATRADILKTLFPSAPDVFVHSFDRPNIALAFAPKRQVRDQILSFLDAQGRVSGIIYCASRNRTEEIAAYLRNSSIDALAYHAGMDAALRTRHQDRFLQDDRVVMVATIAFGMGINKPDVRFVVHADMPSSIESYYQEIGRAGRDGLPSATLTLYGGSDIALARKRIMDKDIDEDRRRIELKRLQAMVDLCENATCRRGAILTYFGEEPGPCQGCDLCGRDIRRTDETLAAQKLLSAIWRTEQRFGAHHLADLLVGTATEAIRRHGHDQIRTFGVGREHPKAWWLTFTRKAMAAGMIEETDGERPGLRLTVQGEEVMRGRAQLLVREDAAPRAEGRRRDGSSRPDPLAGVDPQVRTLFDALKAVRRDLAEKERVAAFMIFPDRSLLEMAQMRPTTREAFARITGVGARKLDAYGAIFLKAIAETLARP